jgi:hypothetical protein
MKLWYTLVVTLIFSIASTPVYALQVAPHTATTKTNNQTDESCRLCKGIQNQGKLHTFTCAHSIHTKCLKNLFKLKESQRPTPTPLKNSDCWFCQGMFSITGTFFPKFANCNHRFHVQCIQGLYPKDISSDTYLCPRCQEDERIMLITSEPTTSPS